MLSKKMAFSLTSLITIFALAFIAVPSVSAGDFNVTITGPTVAAYTEVGTAITPFHLMVTSDQALPATLTADTTDDGNTITIDAYNEDGFSVEKTNGIPAGVTVADQAVADFAGRTAKLRRLLVTLAVDANTSIESIVITIPAFETPDNRVGDADDMSKEVKHTISIQAAPSNTAPKVVSIQRLRPGSQTVVAAFQEAIVTAESFDVRIVFTEKWNVDLAKVGDILEITNGTASNVVAGTPFSRVMGSAGDAATTTRPHPSEGQYVHSLTGVAPGVFNSGNVPAPSGDDDMYHEYRATITPHTKSADFDLKISVKAFHDGGAAVREFYVPAGVDGKPNGREELRLRVKGSARNLTAGHKVVIPKEIRIPGGGYLVIAKNAGNSEVVVPAGSKKDAPKATERTPVQLIYNVIEHADLPNLATQFLNGVVVDVQSQHGLVVSEVMWGEDVSLETTSNSQYIELYNPGGDYVTVDDADHTPDVNEALTLVFYAPNEFGSVPAVDADGDLPAGITDRVGTLGATGAYWSPAGKGQSGRSGTGETEAGPGRTGVATVPIVSMYRVMDAAGEAADGQTAAGWASSAGPKSANFDPQAFGIRHGTPGAATDATDTPADAEAEAEAAAAAAAAAAEKTASTGTIPVNGSVYISEVMFAGGGVLPQWIEIANGSKSEEVNLSGWTLTIANAAADADVSIGASATFTIPDGTTVDASGQNDSPSTILVVTEAGRNNVEASGQVVNLMTDNEVELILAGVTTRKYTLLSSEAFSITLAPPEPAATKAPSGETAAAKATREAADKKAAADRKAASDTVGNLDADGGAAWALPTSEDGRSSIIRRHVQVNVGPAEPEDGTLAGNWALASDTAFAQATHIRAASYYGAQSDVGTPGFRAGGALPVELSHFRPARNKETGAVVITWSTQSELNNAGFFIKRAQQKDGAFQVINAAMVPGAGTTSEKQFYTYTDTTAQPNVVYYYQIEDVSLDGNRQTLTRGIRLKGHVGAAGKATTTWGELKTSNE